MQVDSGKGPRQDPRKGLKMKRKYHAFRSDELDKVIRFETAAETLDGIKRAASKAAGTEVELGNIGYAGFAKPGFYPLSNPAVIKKLLFIKR